MFTLSPKIKKFSGKKKMIEGFDFPVPEEVHLMAVSESGKCWFSFWSEEDQAFVAWCNEYESLSWISNTAQGALDGLRKLVRDIEIGDA